MANKTSTLTVRLIDDVAAPARSAANAIRGIGTAVDQTNARRLNIAGAVQTAVRDIGRATDKIRRDVGKVSGSIGMASGFMAFFGARSVYNFEKMSNKLEAVTNMTGEQKKQIQGYAKELNELFPFTNEQIMGAAFELGRAGFKYEQIIGSLKDTLNLSLAGDIQLQEASDIATNILTAMRLPTKTAEQTADSLRRVNDAIAYTAANSNTDVRMMGETLKYVGPMAAAAGLSIEEVAAASMVMATNGIRASEAGVAMRSALVRMVRPTKPMLAALAQLNVNIDDFIKRGRVISARDVISSLAIDGVDATSYEKQIEAILNDPSINNSLSKLTAKLTDIIGSDGGAMDKSKLAEVITDTLTAAGSEIDFFGFLQALREKGADVGDVARIFDARQGSRLITLLAGDLLGTLEKLEKEAQGSTDKMAKTMMKGVVGDWAAFVASIENLFLSIAESGVLKAAADAIKSLTNGIKWLSETSPTLLKWGSFALLFTAALAPLMLIGGGIIAAIKSLVGGILLIGLAASRVMGIIRAALGLGAAGTAAAGAGGAAAAGTAGATAAGAAGKAGRFAKFMKGAGVVGAALTAAEVLSWVDPEGNLWGLTSGIDKWAEEKFGFNPSKVGATKEKTPDEERQANIDAWKKRQAEIDQRLKVVEAYTPKAYKDKPNVVRDNLNNERAELQTKIDAATAEAQAAAKQTMGSYNAELDNGLSQAEAKIREAVARMVAELNFTVSPTISPRVDMSGISGVHADVGVN